MKVILSISLICIVVIGCHVEKNNVYSENNSINFVHKQNINSIADKLGTNNIEAYEDVSYPNETVSTIHIYIKDIASVNLTDKTALDSCNQFVLDEIQYALGIGMNYDSLIIHYSSQKRSFLFFSEVENTRSYSIQDLKSMRDSIFRKELSVEENLVRLHKLQQIDSILLITKGQLDSNSDDAIALFFRAHSLLESGKDTSEASALLQRLTNTYPRHAQANYTLGLLAMKNEDFPKVKKYMNIVLRYQPRRSIANYYYGCALIMERDTAGALQYFKKTREYGGNYADDNLEWLKSLGYE